MSQHIWFCVHWTVSSRLLQIQKPLAHQTPSLYVEVGVANDTRVIPLISS